jgi:hypothetical protein
VRKTNKMKKEKEKEIEREEDNLHTNLLDLLHLRPFPFEPSLLAVRKEGKKEGRERVSKTS